MKETSFEDHLFESDVSTFHKGSMKLLEIQDNPDKIVRMETFSSLEKRCKGKLDPVEMAEIGQELYEELQDKYGISVPVEFVLGKSPESEDVVYAIVDKIKGENIVKIEPSLELAKEVEGLYEKIARYYLDKFSQKNSFYLVDINSASQYVFGTKKSESLPSVHLVDTDLYTHNGKVALCNVIIWLMRHMFSAEDKFDRKFDTARGIIGNILDAPLPEGLSDEQIKAANKIIDKAKRFLQSGMLDEGDDEVHPIFNELN